MVTRFERPTIGFCPQVYSTFTLRNEQSQEDEEYSIEDLPQDRIEEAAEFMIKYYTKDETFQRAIKVSEATLMAFYRFVLRQKVALACFKKQNRELVALNALSVKTKGIDTSFKSDDEIFQSMRAAYAFINSQFDVFDHYNVNDYLYAHGLAVRTDHRERGIAVEILKARVPLMQACNLSITTSLFTTLGSQKAALKVGFEEDFSISYEKLKQKFKDIDFSSANTPDCKLMSLKI